MLSEFAPVVLRHGHQPLSFIGLQYPVYCPFQWFFPSSRISASPWAGNWCVVQSREYGVVLALSTIRFISRLSNLLPSGLLGTLVLLVRFFMLVALVWRTCACISSCGGVPCKHSIYRPVENQWGYIKVLYFDIESIVPTATGYSFLLILSCCILNLLMSSKDYRKD